MRGKVSGLGMNGTYVLFWDKPWIMSLSTSAFNTLTKQRTAGNFSMVERRDPVRSQSPSNPANRPGSCKSAEKGALQGEYDTGFPRSSALPPSANRAALPHPHPPDYG